MRSRKGLAAVVLLSTAGAAPGQNGQSQPPTSRQAHRTAVPIGPANNNAAAEAGLMMRRTDGSLLQAQLAAAPDAAQVKPTQVSFFAVPDPEPKTLKRHDLVTIVIREESAFSSKESKDIRKEADFDATVDSFVKFKWAKASIVGLPQPANPTEAKMEATREFKGDGNVGRTDSLTARITAEVVDVKPNGTLVLQARKRIKTDEEEQQFVLTGTCRVEDITVDNTILSTQLYDLELQKNHKGDVRNSADRGLIPKLLDFINPF